MRGHYGKNRRNAHPAPAVGASIWQTPGGVVSEINRINDDIALFSAEITNVVRNRGYKTADPMTNNAADVAFWDVQRAGQPDPKDPLVDFFKSTWMQFVTSWRKFFEDNNAWSDNFWWNHAPEAEQFHDQLIELRKTAEGIGMKVSSPDPKTFGKSVLFDPHQNIIDEAHEGAKKAAGDAWSLLKYGVYGALGIAGVLAVTSIVQQIRKDRDPLESYATGYARLRGRY